MRHGSGCAAHEAWSMRHAGAPRVSCSLLPLASCRMPHASWLPPHAAYLSPPHPMADFRFQDLWVWQEACRLGDLLDEISDQLEAARKYRYAEQLRGAALSVSNNIAEGSGSDSNRDFRHFLNIARRSVHENVNIVLFLERKGVIPGAAASVLVEDHRVLAAKISRFRESL